MTTTTAVREDRPAASYRDTMMFAEAAQTGGVVRDLLNANSAVIARITARLRARPPQLVVTCARGSSDHAATYAKYAIETLAGVTTASAALSVASVFPTLAKAPPAAGVRLCLAISQSGRSPDLLAAVAAERERGAFVVAIVNAPGSPLAELADEVIALSAGTEASVAATKSYLASLAALAALVASWTGDRDLSAGVEQLPDLLPRAFSLDWSGALPILLDARNLFVIGRGYGLGAAQEAALKLKETCGLHAECISSAEVKHGPMALVSEGFPVLAFAGSDAAGDDVRQTAALFAGRGARVMLADTHGTPGALPAMVAHPLIEPVLMVQSFYALAARLSVARGHDPDRPQFLRKVTQTI